MTALTWEVCFPEKKRTAFGQKKPCATVTLSSDAYGNEEFFVPVSVGKRLTALDEGFQINPVSRAEFIYELTRIQRDLIRTRIETLLQRRDYSVHELSEKLRLDGFFTTVIEDAVARAVKVGLLDDHRYADLYIRSKVSQGWGPLKIARELKQKGIEPESLEGWPDLYLPSEDQSETALRLARRKRLTGKNDYEKIVRFLASKGYPLGICSATAKRILTEMQVH